MGTEEQLVRLCNNNDANHVVAKGKRTKRLRPLSPCAVAATAAMTSSSSSANSEEHVDAGGDYGSLSSTTTNFESTNQEEKDMANCLILLAQGKEGGNRVNATVTAIAITTARKIGFYIYECKTCNKTFPSFQALGGHRASHKKPKVTQEEKKTPPPLWSPPLITNFEFKEAEETHIKSSLQVPTSLQFGCGNNRGNFHGNKSKIHECSICGSEFTSGQALGGHMRKHRASTNTSTGTSTQAVNMTKGFESSCDAATTAIVEVKPRIVLELDLNLPAPEEDIWDSSKFQFTATQNSMVLSPAPALVGCHY